MLKSPVGHSVEGTGVQNHQLPFRNLGNFVHPTLRVAFGRDLKSRRYLLPGVRGIKFARREIKKCGLTNSSEG